MKRTKRKGEKTCRCGVYAFPHRHEPQYCEQKYPVLRDGTHGRPAYCFAKTSDGCMEGIPVSEWRYH
jgi:hypothetical protein